MRSRRPAAGLVRLLTSALLLATSANGRAQPAGEPYPPPYPSDAYPQAPYGAPPPQPSPNEPDYPPPSAGVDPTALGDFRGALEQYGRWVDDPTYGTVWVPSPSSVGPGFEPYLTAGHWAYDETGWTWVSDYPWGWITFHYGRWVSLPAVGWAWVPGDQYAGAWVQWRVGAGLVGWAPLPPDWALRGGAVVPLEVPPGSGPYFFAPPERLFAPNLPRYVGTGPTYIARTRPFVQSAPPARRALGPPPATLGIAPGRVVRPSPSDAGVWRARSYAGPSAGEAHPGRTAPG